MIEKSDKFILRTRIMKIWKNTPTLNGYDEGFSFTEDKIEADILLLGSKPVNIDDFPNVKGIFRAGISKDNIPAVDEKSRRITIRFPSEQTIKYIYDETANFTCSLIFRMNYQNVGSINPWKKHDRMQLQDKVLLVIGTGNIGNIVANKMRNFLKVLTFDIRENNSTDFHSMIPEADFISLHIPNLPENRSFFDYEKLGMMKDGATLINTARGPIVDEDALLDELNKDRIRAAFDVFWEEPYQGRLLKFYPEKFFMTPHIASTCIGFLKGCSNDLKKLIEELSID